MASKLKANSKQQKITKKPKNVPATLELQVPEFPYFKKGPFWYLAVTVISAILVVNFILAEKYFLTLIFLVILIIFLRLSWERPKKIAIKMDLKGLRYGYRFYPWSVFLAFGVWQENRQRLNVYIYFPNFLSIPLLILLPNNRQSAKVIDFLRLKTPEKFLKRKGLIETINAYLRF